MYCSLSHSKCDANTHTHMHRQVSDFLFTHTHAHRHAHTHRATDALALRHNGTYGTRTTMDRTRRSSLCREARIASFLTYTARANDGEPCGLATHTQTLAAPPQANTAKIDTAGRILREARNVATSTTSSPAVANVVARKYPPVFSSPGMCERARRASVRASRASVRVRSDVVDVPLKYACTY